MALPAFDSPRLGKFADADAEVAFQSWYATHAARLGMSPSPDDPRHRYDFRNAFLEGYEPDENGLWDYRASADFAKTASRGTRATRVNVRGAPADPDAAAAPAPEVAPTKPSAAPIPLTDAQRADAMARLDAIQSRVQTFSSALDYYAKGFIAPEEAAGYRSTSKDVEEYARRMAAHGAAFERGMMTGEDVLRAQIDNSFMARNLGGRQAAGFFAGLRSGLADTGVGALKVGIASQPGVLRDVTADSIIIPLRDHIETELFGLPRDPIERAGYDAAFPQLARLLGDVAAFGAVAAATSGVGTAVGIPRMLTAARGARGLVALNATGGIGGALIAAATAPDDPSAMRVLEGGMIGLGGTALVSSLLAGRPIGTPARLLRLQEMATALDAAGVGGAMRVAPRLAFGRLAMSGLEGAGYVTLGEMGRGTPVDEAIGLGVEEGIKFVGYDTAFIGLGRAARWLPLHAKVGETWAETASAFKIKSAMAANITAQAAPGAAIGSLLGPVGAMVGGAISAAKAAELQQVMVTTAARLRSTGQLTGETIDKIITGSWTKLTAEEAESVTKALMKDTVERAVADAEPALAYAVAESMGSDSPLLASNELKAMAIRRGQLTQELTQLRAQGILEVDPAVVQRSRALAELAERRSQLLIEDARLVGSAQARADYFDGKMMEQLIDGAARNPGLAITGDVTARDAAARLMKSARIAAGDVKLAAANAALRRGATEAPTTRVLFRSNATLLRDLGDTALESAGINARLSRDAERALDRLASPRLLTGATPLRVAPAGARGVKAPLDTVERGAVRTDLLRVAGGSALGAALGGTADDDTTRGAIAGALIGGAGAAAGERLLARTGRLEDRAAATVERRSATATRAQFGRELAARVAEMHSLIRENAARMTAPQLRRANELTDDYVRTALRRDLARGVPLTEAAPVEAIFNDVEAAAANAAQAKLDAALADQAMKRAPIARYGEEGYVRGGLVGALGSGAVGAVLAPAIAHRLNLLDEEDSVLTASAIGFLATSAIGYRILERQGARLDPVATRVARFVQPTITGATLPAADITRVVGKTGNAFRATVDGSQVSGRRLYWLLPQPAQIDHTVRTLTAWPSRTVDSKGKAIDLAERRRLFEHDLARFAPFSVTDNDMQRVTTAFLGATKSLNYTPAQTARLYKGMLGWMTTPLENRAIVDIDRMSLDMLGRNAANPFNTAEGIAQLQRRAAMADTITGPPMPLPRNYRRSTNSINRDGTPDSTRIRALVDEIDGLGIELNAPGHKLPADTLYSLWHLPGLRLLAPAVRNYRFADTLKSRGDAAGPLVERVTRSIMSATELARGADDTDRKIISAIFRAIRTPDEMSVVRNAIEDATFRESIRGTSPRIYEAALATRKFLRAKADTLGLAEQQRIEDYFPWVYNYRTKRELAELTARGRVPTDVNYPIDAPTPRHVYFNHLESRTATAPLGQQLNPLESLLMYSHGANRKVMYDQLLANFGSDTFATIRQTQPEIAHELGRWLLDVVGVPGPGTMAVQKRVEQVGLWLESFPMFNRPGFAQQLNEQYFLSPGGANNLSRVVTGWAYSSKVAWNFLSAIINASQMVVSGATEYGLLNVMTSAIPGAGISATVNVGERVPALAPIFDAITPMGARYRKLLTESGILAETSQRHLDALALYEAAHGSNRAHLAVVGALTGAPAGAAATAFMNRDAAPGDEISLAAGAATGAAVMSVGAAKSAIMRRALLRVRDAGTFTFNAVETWNRATIGIASLREARGATRALTDAPYAARRVLGEKVEGVIAGALGGAALGRLTDGDDGLASGATAGALLAAAGTRFGESRTARTQRALAGIRSSDVIFSNRIIRDQAKDGLRPLTDDEVGTLYAQMQTDITQFRIAKEGRNPYLNTPHGQALGALQSYTINQAEFVGGRMATFAETASRALRGEPVAVDFRIFRYGSFLLATGSVYGAIIGGSADSETDPDYWVSRLGFGVMPMLHWNDTARRWELLSPTDMFRGPLIGDITRTANSYMALLRDEQANATFADISDRVAANLFPGAKAIADERRTREGAAALKLMQEGVMESIAPTPAPAPGVQQPRR
jgi:hypothetical protein